MKLQGWTSSQVPDAYFPYSLLFCYYMDISIGVFTVSSNMNFDIYKLIYVPTIKHVFNYVNMEGFTAD
jgi:hypothetical protein